MATENMRQRNLEALGGRQQEVVDVLNQLRDAVLYAAARVADDPRQLSRLLDGFASLADGLVSRMISVRGQPVEATITKIREAAMGIGFGKLVTRRGRQEMPED